MAVPFSNQQSTTPSTPANAPVMYSTIGMRLLLKADDPTTDPAIRALVEEIQFSRERASDLQIWELNETLFESAARLSREIEEAVKARLPAVYAEELKLDKHGPKGPLHHAMAAAQFPPERAARPNTRLGVTIIEIDPDDESTPLIRRTLRRYKAPAKPASFGEFAAVVCMLIALVFLVAFGITRYSMCDCDGGVVADYMGL